MWKSGARTQLLLKLSLPVFLVSVMACKGKQTSPDTVPVPLTRENAIQTLWNFDDSQVGGLPPGWQIAATRQQGPLQVGR